MAAATAAVAAPMPFHHRCTPITTSVQPAKQPKKLISQPPAESLCPSRFTRFCNNTARGLLLRCAPMYNAALAKRRCDNLDRIHRPKSASVMLPKDLLRSPRVADISIQKKKVGNFVKSNTFKY